MYSFAHISDTHLAPLPQPHWYELLGKRLTGYLNWKKHRKNQLDNATLPALIADIQKRSPKHLLISGDLVNLSLNEEFNRAHNWVKELGSPNDTTLTLGNHDAYVLGAFNQACKSFAPWLTNDEEPKWDTQFPFMRRRGPIAFISVSSALATPPFCASGYFGESQAKKLAILLQQAKQEDLFRVVMIHHPPIFHATYRHKKLWGIQRFQDVIRNYGAEIILHGHTHLPTINTIQSVSDEINVFGVASASQAFGGRKPAANYNWFNVGKIGKQWRYTMTRYTVVDKNNTIEPTESLIKIIL